MDSMFKPGPKALKGKIWEEKGRSEVVEILISHQQDHINSIRFTYRTGKKLFRSQTYGEPNGLNFDMVEFGYPNEVLTSISGDLMDGRLASITFNTNKKKYGPFGRTGSRSSVSSYEEFKYEVKRGRFGGFHGSVEDGSLYAIGVYVKLECMSNRPRYILWMMLAMTLLAIFGILGAALDNKLGKQN